MFAVIRIFVIGFVLIWVARLCSQGQQWLLNVLALPVILWMAFSLLMLPFRSRKAKRRLVADIRQMSKVTDAACIDACNGSAIALNYADKNIYLIADKTRKVLPLHELMRWEVIYNDGHTMVGGMVGGMDSSPAGQAVIGGVIGFGVFSVISHLLFRRKDIGHIKFWIKDPTYPILNVDVSNHNIIERLQHFSMVQGMNVT